MRSLIIYAALGLIAGALTTFLIFRVTQDLGEKLAKAQEERLATWEELLE